MKFGALSVDETEKEKAEELRQIIIPMIIFMLEHQFVIVGIEGGGERGGRVRVRMDDGVETQTQSQRHH